MEIDLVRDALVAAMGVRGLDERLLSRKQFKEAGHSYSLAVPGPISEVLVKAHTNAYNYVLGSAIEWSEDDIDALMFRFVDREDAYVAISRVLDSRSNRLTQEQLWNMVEPSDKLHAVSPMGLNSRGIHAIFEEALRLADETGTPAINFFRDDVDFAKLVKCVQTPEDFVDRAIERAEDYNRDRVGRIIMNEQKPIQYFNMADSTFEAFVQTCLDQTNFVAFNVKPQIDRARTAARTVLIQNLLRFWPDDYQVSWNLMEEIESIGDEYAMPFAGFVSW